MKTIATINFKGGVGKTTCTWALGYVAAQSPANSSLVFDLDAQMSLTQSIALNEDGEPFKSFTDWYDRAVAKKKTIFDALDEFTKASSCDRRHNGKASRVKRDDGDDKNFEGFFRDAGDKESAFVNREQWMVCHGNMGHQPRGDVAQDEYAQRPKDESAPHHPWRLWTAIGGHNKPQQQQRGRNGGGNDSGRGEVGQEHRLLSSTWLR